MADVMMDGWGALQKEQQKAEVREKTKGISRFNPKKDQEYEIVVLTGNPVCTSEHFDRSTNRSYLCTMASKGKCRHCGPKNKPSKKWHFLVINRSAVAYKKNEETGEYEDVMELVPDPKNKGKKIRVPKIEPRLQVMGRGQRDTGSLAALAKKYGGLVGIAFDVMKTGEGTSSAMQFIPKDGNKKASLTEAELKLINGRSEDELRELVYNFVAGVQEDEIPVVEDGKDPEMGSEESWDEEDGAFEDGDKK